MSFVQLCWFDLNHLLNIVWFNDSIDFISLTMRLSCVESAAEVLMCSIHEKNDKI